MLLLRWRKAGMLAWAAVWIFGLYAMLALRLHGADTGLRDQDLHGHRDRLVDLRLCADREGSHGRVLAADRGFRHRAALSGLALAAVVLADSRRWWHFRIHAGMTATPAGAVLCPHRPPGASGRRSPSTATTCPVGTSDNPYRELETSNPAEFAESGWPTAAQIYYQNCFYCHGDLMGGAGMFAHALNPIPTNFQDPGTIAMLREAFLFWRIAKGAPGMPEEGGPWQSAMPAWENFLSEEEMWNVILFLYDFTGYKPAGRGDALMALTPPAPLSQPPLTPVPVERGRVVVLDPGASSFSAPSRLQDGRTTEGGLGQEVYVKWCAHCHGDQGDGLGVAASRLNPKPRDFTSGKYKIRMTTTGNIPARLGSGQRGASRAWPARRCRRFPRSLPLGRRGRRLWSGTSSRSRTLVRGSGAPESGDHHHSRSAALRRGSGEHHRTSGL